MNGACVCDEGWTSADCAVLDLLPSDPAHWYAPEDGRSSSWGMSVGYDDAADEWHGFVSEFANECKLGSWTTNSYINHITAPSPVGPWTRHEAVVDIWSHNPRLVHSSADGEWLLFHIGSGTHANTPKNCTRKQAPAAGRAGNKVTAAASTTVPHSAAAPSGSDPFVIHHSPSLNGPWVRFETAGSAKRRTGQGRMTLQPGTRNVAPLSPPTAPEGGLWMYERPDQGHGKLYVPFKSGFVANAHRSNALAWDACGAAGTLAAPKFDNGHPLHTDSGCAIDTISVNTSDSTGQVLMVGTPCALTYSYPNVDLRGPFGAADARVNVSAFALGVDYFELAFNSSLPDGVHLAGTTQDAEGCRGVCEADEQSTCSSYTWIDGGDGGGDCYLRSDWHWAPDEGTMPGATSGRPWTFDGDNPSPIVDSNGEVRVLYRTDTRGGMGAAHGTDAMASLIGQARAPHWKGPYEPLSAFGGPISSSQYPFEENEDPFLFKDKRGGLHALLHATTWGDSRGKIWPVAQYAGRHAFSSDGTRWTYSTTPAYTGTVHFRNGSSAAFSRLERPVLVFNGSTPRYLINGVQRYDWDDKTFTLITEIRSAAKS